MALFLFLRSYYIDPPFLFLFSVANYLWLQFNIVCICQKYTSIIFNYFVFLEAQCLNVLMKNILEFALLENQKFLQNVFSKHNKFFYSRSFSFSTIIGKRWMICIIWTKKKPIMYVENDLLYLKHLKFYLVVGSILDNISHLFQIQLTYSFTPKRQTFILLITHPLVMLLIILITVIKY